MVDLASDVDSDSESDSDSDTHDEVIGTHASRQSIRDRLSSWAARTLPPPTVTKNVLKCVAAYFLAELWTFVPILTDWLGGPFDVDGPVKNAHVVATIAVYFYPARTIGGMVEADLLMVVGVAYAMFLANGSMAMSVYLDRRGLENLGHALVLIIWIGGGYSLLAWVKCTANKPTVTTVCSMVSLFTSVIITKEGAFHNGEFQSYAILQVLLIAAIGSATSNLVCFGLWPVSATSKLQNDLNRTLGSFSTLIDMLTKTFLLDGDIDTRPESLRRAIDAHQSSYTTLKTSLAQAKYEVLDSRISGMTDTYDEVVQTMLRLSQGLNGMRAGCTLQFDLMQAGALSDVTAKDKPGSMTIKLRDELMVLERFKDRVGPSLLALARVSQKTLSLLRTSFMRTKQGAANRRALSKSDDAEAGLTAEALGAVRVDLEQSLLLFKREHSRATRLLYRTMPEQTVYNASELEDASDPFADVAGVMVVNDDDDHGPNDNLFRIYNFCFNYEEWAKQLCVLVEEFQDIRSTEEIVERRAIERRKKWGPLAGLLSVFAAAASSMRKSRRRTWSRGRSLRQKAAGVKSGIARLLSLTEDGGNPFPQVVDGALTSHQFDRKKARSSGARFKQAIWMLGWRLRQPNVRYAIKTGAGAAVLSAAAFTSYRPLWLKWRGEWALISYMVIMAQSLGATNFLALGRILGTFGGAVAAVGCYSAFPENAFVLPVLGALVSVPCFYVIVTRPQYGPSSRFVLLTFNLTCLYAFNLREVDTHVVSIAFHRSIAVAGGVGFALLVTNLIWPYEARRELRNGLSQFFLNAAHLYTTIVKSYSLPPRELAHAMASDQTAATETTALLTSHLDSAEEQYMAMEVYLQRSLIKLQGLLAATAHEPRLKGPFPVQTYRTILTSSQNILDLLTSIQQATTREAWYKSIRRDFIQHVQQERRQMVGNVILYFSLLASALTLKTPLPAFLPPAAEARATLVKKLRTLEVVKKRIVRGGSEGLLYLGYALKMKDVIQQLDLIGGTFQELFGIIGGAESTEEFEALFHSLDGSSAGDSDRDEANGDESSGTSSPREV